MARPLRVEYAGAMYHVMSRGNRKGRIFAGNGDRVAFLELLARACEKTGWQVHAYCLMGNHFHLVVETPEANLVVGMKWLLGVYTQRYNARHNEVGHLFGGRYKAMLIDESSPAYLRTACDYVHLNPARAGLVKEELPLESYAWSSYPEYLKAPRQRVSWVRTDRVLGDHGAGKDDSAARRRFQRRMESLRTDGLPSETLERLREGWRFGAEDFLERVLELTQVKPRESHPGEAKRETSEQRAQTIIREEFERRGWKEKELAKLAKADPAKVAMARRIRQETTMSLKWIAERLQMGSWKNVANNLSEGKKMRNSLASNRKD